MENKQTAVEWLVEQLAIKTGSSFHAITFYHDNNELINQAKAMEQKEHSRIANKSHEEGWKEGKYGQSRW